MNRWRALGVYKGPEQVAERLSGGCGGRGGRIAPSRPSTNEIE